jgi:hypothetical protein
MPPPLDLNPVHLVRSMVATFRLVCALMTSRLAAFPSQNGLRSNPSFTLSCSAGDLQKNRHLESRPRWAFGEPDFIPTTLPWICAHC